MLLTTMMGWAAVAAAGGAQSNQAYRKAELEKMTTAELASAMLLPNLAEVVSSHELNSGLYPEDNYSGVSFLTTSWKIDQNFCGRRRIYVSLDAAERNSEERPRSDAPVRPTDLNFFQQVALASDCDGARNFAHLNSVDITMGMELLSYLDGLRRKAGQSAVMRLKVSCATDLDDDSCGAGPIARLANLKLEQAHIIERATRFEGGRWKWRVSIPEVPGTVGPYAEVRLDGPPMYATEIEIRRRLPAPF